MDTYGTSISINKEWYRERGTQVKSGLILHRIVKITDKSSMRVLFKS